METSIVKEVHLKVLNKVALRVGGRAVEAERAWGNRRRKTVTTCSRGVQRGSGCGLCTWWEGVRAKGIVDGHSECVGGTKPSVCSDLPLKRQVTPRMLRDLVIIDPLQSAYMCACMCVWGGGCIPEHLLVLIPHAIALPQCM